MLSKGMWWQKPKRVGWCGMKEPAQKLCKDGHILGFKIETWDSNIETERGRGSDQLLW